jgi:hypothetical protein
LISSKPAYCLVKIPHPVGGENECLIDGASLFDAVRRALEINEGFVGQRPDDLVVTVIEDGKQSVYWDYAEHNAKKRKWRVRVGRARE